MNFDNLISIISGLQNKNAVKNFFKWADDGLISSGSGNPVFYHGSPDVSNIASFSKKDMGKNTGAPETKMFMGFGSSSPDLAGEYATTQVRHGIYPDNFFEKIGTEGFSPGIMPLLYKAQKPHVVDFGGTEYSERALRNIANEAVGNGSDAIVLKNILDSLNPGGGVSDVVAVRHPTQIKSLFNRGTFDPLDSNILRSSAPWLAGGGVAAGSFFGAGDAQAAPYAHADANNLDRTIERLSKAMPLNDMASGMIPRATQASVQPINNMGAWQQMEQQGRVTPDLPVPEAEWSPVDLATAPIGAAGKIGKLAAMALDAPTSLAVNRLIDALSSGANTASNWWNRK